MFPYPFKIYQEELPEDFCKHVIALGESLEREEAAVYKEGFSEFEKDSRNNSVSWLNNPDIIELLQIYTVKANQECGWNFDINVYETPQLSTMDRDWETELFLESFSNSEKPSL